MFQEVEDAISSCPDQCSHCHKLRKSDSWVHFFCVFGTGSLGYCGNGEFAVGLKFGHRAFLADNEAMECGV